MTVRIVLENDPALRLVPVVLDPASPHAATRAYADFVAHDEPDFEGWRRNLREKIPGLFPADIVSVDTPDDLTRELPAAKGVIVESLDISEPDLANAPNLSFVQKFGGLASNIDVEACAKHNIAVNLQRRRVNVAVAEQAFMFMIALAKQVVTLNGVVDESRLRKAGFRPDPFDRRYTVNSNYGRVPGLRTLHGAVLGAIGMGEVGREVALRAKAFGMRTLYYKRTRLTPIEEEYLGVRYVSLDQLLQESDLISIHLPLTDSTRGMFNREVFKNLRPGAILVNVARAAIVDHDAVIEALTTGHLGGFALDAGYDEPAKADEPLLQFKNVIMMPHTAPATRQNVLLDMEEMCLKMWHALQES